MSVFWRLGGAGYLYFRRIGAPVLVFVFALLNHLVWGGIVSAAALFGATLLPLFWLNQWMFGLIVAFLVGISYSSLLLSAEFYRLKTGKDVWYLFELSFGFIYVWPGFDYDLRRDHHDMRIRTACPLSRRSWFK